MKEKRCCTRSRGSTLIELLVATSIMSVAAVLTLSLYSLNTVELSKFWNKGDVLTSATDAIGRIGITVRGARGLGDNFGNDQPLATSSPILDVTKLQSGDPQVKQNGINTGVVTNNLLNGTAFLISPIFPSPGDPYYYSGGAPTLPVGIYNGAWPFPPQLSGAAAGQYTLAQDTLIVQVPVFVGTPPGGGGIGIDPSTDNPLWPSAVGPQAPYIWPATFDGNGIVAGGPVLQAVDTYVFRVIPDPGNPGTWVMQEAAFPACPNGAPNPLGGTYNGHPTNNTLPLSQPMVLLKGIVGPLDAQGNISVFSYIEKISNTSTNTPPAAGFLTTDYNGVVVNLEVVKSQEGTKAAVAHFKSEFFMRNNSQATLESP